MRILSVILFMQIEQVTLFGCLRGAGDTRFTALVSLISVTFIRPGMSWLLCYPLGLGLMGAWLGTLVTSLSGSSSLHPVPQGQVDEAEAVKGTPFSCPRCFQRRPFCETMKWPVVGICP